jgi:hypothetical protein
MISYLPLPYEDETMPSWFVRYQRHTLSKGYTNSAMELFGSKEARVSAHFQFRVNALVENISHICPFNATDIIERFTTWNFHKRFIHNSRHRMIIDTLKYGTGSGLLSKIGWAGSSYCIPFKTMYCPICSREQLEKFGEFYWMRIHQIPYISICPLHYCYLKDPIKKYREKIKFAREAVIPDFDDTDFAGVVFEHDKIIQDLSARFVQILKGDHQFALSYKDRLRERGYYYGKFCQITSLRDNFNKFYGRTLSLYTNSYMNSAYKIFSKTLVTRPESISNPVRHILMDYFLDFGPVLNTNYKERFHDIDLFGKGPWHCVNKTCKQFKKKVIEKGEFIYRERHTLLHLSCECGMKYVLSYPNDRGKNRPVIKILEYGPLWKKELKALLRKATKRSRAHCIYKIAEKLGVRQYTVKTHAAKMKIEHAWSNLTYQSRPRVDIKAKIAENRKVLKRLKGKYSFVSDLKRENRALCSLQKKYDGEWFDKHIEYAPYSDRTLKKDIEREDQKFLKKAKAVFSELKSKNLESRIAKGTVLKIMGQQPDLSKLQETRRFLEEEVETLEQYQLRRLENVIAKIRGSSRISQNSILAKAGIYKPSEKILERVNSFLLKLRYF